jgi:hypothetical protein
MPPAFVVLGASNVSRGLARLVAAARGRQAGPLDLFVAAGHGRSYGANSRVFMRCLPSILWSGLWRALDRERVGLERPGSALVTDIGNDLLYGFSVDQLASWVRESLVRLTERGLRIAITRLPLASIDRVGPVRYRALRTCYVPGCTLSLPELKNAATRMDDAVVELAAEFRATLLDQPADWYGLDAIHVRRSRLDDLWQRAGDAWGLPAAAGRPRASLGEWARIGSRAAEVRSLFHAMRYTPQPSYRSPDDLRLWMF